jgi:hypothetical protein
MDCHGLRRDDRRPRLIDSFGSQMRKLIDRNTVEFLTQEPDKIFIILSATNGPDGWELDSGLFTAIWNQIERMIFQ